MELPQGYRTDGVICPHCGKQYDNLKATAPYSAPVVKDGVEMGVTHCINCSQKFMVEQTKIMIYKTTKMDS